MRRIAITILVTLNVFLTVTFATSSSFAHSADVFYAHRWDLDSTVHYKIDSGVPTGWRDQIRDGFQEWSDRVGGRAPKFAFNNVENLTNPYTPCNGANAVFARNLDADGLTGALGYTPGCRLSGGRYTGFSMVLDTDPSGGGAIGWYLGDDVVPDNRWDLQSIATHEAGHATGFYGHFDAGQPICQGPDRETMCAGSSEPIGTKYLRTLEAHDRHTIQAAYPDNPCPPVCKVGN